MESKENNSFNEISSEPIEKAEEEEKEQPFSTLKDYLEALQQEGIKTLSEEDIKEQLEQTGIAIITRDFARGIRISREGTKNKGYTYKTWTTNILEDPDHPLAKKFGRKELTID